MKPPYHDLISHFCFLAFRFISIQFSRYILVGSNGLEPSTSRLSGVRSNHLSYEPISVAASTFRLFGSPCFFRDISIAGGDEQIRTVDPLLARQVLSQLSYTPISQGFPTVFESLLRPSKLNNVYLKSKPNTFSSVTDLGCWMADLSVIGSP